MCTVFVRIIPLPGHRDATRELILELLPQIRTLPGCEEYRLFDAVTGELMLSERWSTREQWQAHFEAAPIQRLKTELADKVELPVERSETYEAPPQPEGIGSPTAPKR